MYSIGQIAKMASVSNRTLRYYEELGLIAPKSRGSNKYRYYEEEHLQRLQTIKMLQEAGFALKEIVAAFAPILDPNGHVPPSGQDMARKIFQALETQRKVIIDRQQDLQQALHSLQATMSHLQQCFGCKISANINDCGQCEKGPKEITSLGGQPNGFRSPTAATYMVEAPKEVK